MNTVFFLTGTYYSNESPVLREDLFHTEILYP